MISHFEDIREISYEDIRELNIYLQIIEEIFKYLNVNKRPKGPHIVYLSTMCHLFDRSARAEIFVYSSA